MKISRLCLLVVMSLLCTGLAFADGIQDPKIIIHGVSGASASSFGKCPGPSCTNVGLNFTFAVPEKGKGNLFFTNASGKNWTSLKLIEKGVPAAAISCGNSFFRSCTVTTLRDGSVQILLSGVRGTNTPRNGILNGQNFAITFGCVEGTCWPGGLNFTAHASAAPEPGTIALMVTGIGAIISRRKRLMKSLKA